MSVSEPRVEFASSGSPSAARPADPVVLSASHLQVWYGTALALKDISIDIPRNRITALAGLAPFACESGLQRGRRAIWGGRGDARAMLFLAAQSAARWNPPLRLFYERLVSRGKSKKAALAAVARKLLIAINAMMRDQRPWQPAIVAEPSCC